MAVIGEAYFHIKPFELDADSLPELGKRLSMISDEIAENVFWFDTVLEIELAPGSAKGWSRAQVALNIFLVVAVYSDFRTSMQRIYDDVQLFAQKVNETFIDSLNIDPDQVFRTERRTKSVGRLKRLLDEIDELDKSCNLHARPPSQDKIENYYNLLELALDDLTLEERELVLQGLNSSGSPIAPQMPLSKFIVAPTPPRIERRGHTGTMVAPLPPTYEIKGGETSLVMSRKYVLPNQLVVMSASIVREPSIQTYRMTIRTKSKRQKVSSED